MRVWRETAENALSPQSFPSTTSFDGARHEKLARLRSVRMGTVRFISL